MAIWFSVEPAHGAIGEYIDNIYWPSREFTVSAFALDQRFNSASGISKIEFIGWGRGYTVYCEVLSKKERPTFTRMGMAVNRRDIWDNGRDRNFILGEEDPRLFVFNSEICELESDSVHPTPIQAIPYLSQGVSKRIIEESPFDFHGFGIIKSMSGKDKRVKKGWIKVLPSIGKASTPKLPHLAQGVSEDSTIFGETTFGPSKNSDWVGNDYNGRSVAFCLGYCDRIREYYPKYIRTTYVDGIGEMWKDTLTNRPVFGYLDRDIDVSVDGIEWFHVFGRVCKYGLVRLKLLNQPNGGM